MKALILAGSKGVELLPLTANVPKPVVHVGNIPFIFYQLDSLKRAGVKEVVLSLSYLPRRIKDILGDGANYGMVIRYAVETVPLGTAGALRNAADMLEQKVIVMNGDILTSLDLGKVIREHQHKHAQVTLVTGRAANPSHFGVVNLDARGTVTDFTEKPRDRMLPRDQVNVGIYVFNASVLSRIPADTHYTLERDLFPRLIETGVPIHAFCTNDYWTDIGDPAGYLQANLDVIAGKVALPKFFGLYEKQPVTAPANSRIDDKSLIDPSCMIKPGVDIENSVIGPNCRIEDGVMIRDSVLLQGTRVKAGASLRYCIVGKHCVVGEGVSVTRGAVFGDKSTVTDYSTF